MSVVLGLGVVAFVLLFFVLVVTALVLAAVHGRRQAQARRSGMAHLAAAREWEFAPADPSLVKRFRRPPFGRGGSRSATNVVRGRVDGRHFVVFDYTFATTDGTSGHDSGASSTTWHHYSIVATHLGVTAPALSVAPSGTLSRLINAVTGSDIAVGDPLFDRTFTVKCSSPEFARDILHPQLTRTLLQWPALAWRFEDDSMVVVRRGRHTPDQVDAMLALNDAVLRQVPALVWARLGTAPR